MRRKYRLSEETKRRLSEAAKNRKLSKETRRKISESNTGKKHPLYGKHHSVETKKKISKANKGKHPSIEARKKMSEAHKGKKNHNWKGGITPENRRVRRGIECRLWRESVFARDNWTCQKTGVKGCRLNAHHIRDFSTYPEGRFAIDNGITLSVEAHQEFHNIYGQSNNTREQMEEFLGLKL